ncbi:MAG: hypothetical protein HC913_15065, partial [Microscillaceae bacterium]|nr:hypothetical protein [Microscillaceae bacterium]
MNRRQFLTRALPAATLPFLVGGLPVYAHTQTALTRLWPKKTNANDRVLVLIQLNGGNDGLNTFVPIDQYARLANARPRLLLPENQLHKINPAQGFHPAMATFRQLFQEGKLGIVQDVGYPYPNFSHFRSTDIWTSASDSDQIITSGWVGRYLAQLHPDYPDAYPNSTYPDPLALTIGPIVSATCQGPS